MTSAAVVEGAFVVLLAAFATAVIHGIIEYKTRCQWEDAYHRAKANLRLEVSVHASTQSRLAREEREHAKTKDAAQQVLLSVVPLVEKTDWMTGRWGGQFNALVRMENERNKAVDAVRRALFSIPFVNETGVNLIRSGR